MLREEVEYAVVSLEKANNELVQDIEDLRETQIDEGAIRKDKFADLREQFNEQKKQIKDLKISLSGTSKDLKEALRELEDRSNHRIDTQFNEFLVRIDGELTRRNRMRLDTQTKFKRVDNFIDMVKSELDRFETNQKLVIGTMRKLTYANDVQSQLNIQDEIDREWISLFAGLDDRTGY